MEVSGDGAAGLDLIRISGIRHYGYTGFFAEEQVLGQWFEVNLSLWLDLATTEALLQRFGAELRARGALVVSESGLFTRDDLDRVQSAGADAVLVGEALMRQNDVTAALETLIGG